MKVFHGRPVVPGRAKAEALVSRDGFNVLASYQKSLLSGDKNAACSDQNNPRPAPESCLRPDLDGNSEKTASIKSQ